MVDLLSKTATSSSSSLPAAKSPSSDSKLMNQIDYLTSLLEKKNTELAKAQQEAKSHEDELIDLKALVAKRRQTRKKTIIVDGVEKEVEIDDYAW